MTKARPTLDFAIRQSEVWLGGSPDGNRALVLILGALVHGTALNMITGVIAKENAAELRDAFSKAVDVLIANRTRLRS